MVCLAFCSRFKAKRSPTSKAALLNPGSWLHCPDTPTASAFSKTGGHLEHVPERITDCFSLKEMSSVWKAEPALLLAWAELLQEKPYHIQQFHILCGSVTVASLALTRAEGCGV